MRLQVLGGLDLTTSTGEEVQGATRQTRLMLSCLAVAGAKGINRTEFCSLFWPDRALPRSRNSLRQGLAAVRRILAAELNSAGALAIDSDLERVRLSVDPAAIDLHAFQHGIQLNDAKGWVAAAAAYHGDLLSGIEVSDELDEWLATPRRANHQQALALAERMSSSEGTGPEVVDAVEELAERLLMSSPAAEEAHRALIRVRMQRGRTNTALRQFEQCREALRAELQAEPDAQTAALAPRLRSQASSSSSVTAAVSLPIGRAPTADPDRERPSVFVMPFDNLSGGADDYFVDGVVEEITSALSRVQDFFVIARQSAFTYKGRFVDVREVGRELGVTYVVEGTVRRGGDRLRISVQLVDAGSRAQLWPDRCEGASPEIFEFQDQIAAQVAGAMHPAIRRAEIEAAGRKPPSNLRSYDLAIRAYPKLSGQIAAAINEAIATLNEATRIDQSYGRAYALLAWCHALKVTYIWSSERERDLEAACRAVEATRGLIEDDPTALTAAGAATGHCGDQEGASALIEQAIALDPNNAWAWTRWGWIGIYRGQPDRASERFEMAMRLSPLDPFVFNTRMAIAAARALPGRLDEAIAIARVVTNKHPDATWPFRQLAAWSAMKGDMETARWAAQRTLAAHPEFTIERYLGIPTFRNVPAFRDGMAAGLRAAGLPER